MPKAITQKDLNKIAAMIREWPKDQPFKWENICVGARTFLGFVPTRQALSKKPMLVNAYTTKKKQLKLAVEGLSKVPKPQSMLHAMTTIARLQEENDALKSELSKMAEVANRFIHNASMAGLSREKLMAPLTSLKNGD